MLHLPAEIAMSNILTSLEDSTFSCSCAKEMINGGIDGHLNDCTVRNNKSSLSETTPNVKGPKKDPLPKDEEDFLKAAFQVIMEDGVRKGRDVTQKVVDFHQPDELRSLLDLEIRDAPEDHQRLIKHMKDTIKYSVRTGHPRFFNQLFSGKNTYALAGQWLTETLNTSQYTFEVAPVFTIMESVVLHKMREVVGYTAGDGIFCPGGSISNLCALNVARYRYMPDIKKTGLFGLPRLVVFTSKQSHYSIKKAASVLGIGTNNVVLINCDERGKMITSDLEAHVLRVKAEGAVPFFVNCTSGTTVLGAYDPLEEVADVCEKHGLWMHVDAAWGGGVMMSPKYRASRMRGVERSDSITWNPHKMMGAGQQCSALLLKHENLLQDCNEAKAKYLFQQDKFYDVSYDTGDKSIQCGRKVDVFKLWLMWKAKGNQGYHQDMDAIFDKTRYLVEKVKAREGFKLVLDEPECSNVCFWYIPPSLRGKEDEADYKDKLHQVAPKIKERMVLSGTMLVGYQPLGNKPNFFRQVFCSPAVTEEDLDFLIDEIERLGEDL
ncbi:GAD1 [Branchiostoma lanceolatum]|uniref:GAD1 protein n=1 Tax=Branchiostoma lanceolatum TaxID=7740 RepID=A0A8J9YTA1_BRALA|nr:GAD1 [Branchiostoma lanceolatum]